MMNFSQIALSVLNSGWFSLIFIIAIVWVFFPGNNFDFWDKLFLACICIISFTIIASMSYDSEQKLVDSGKYYTENCVLIEENIDNGFFSKNTNKLQCGETLKNVTVNDYNNAIDAYKKKRQHRG